MPEDSAGSFLDDAIYRGGSLFSCQNRKMGTERARSHVDCRWLRHSQEAYFLCVGLDGLFFIHGYSLLLNKCHVTFINFWQNSYLVYVLNFYVVILDSHDGYSIHDVYSIV